MKRNILAALTCIALLNACSKSENTGSSQEFNAAKDAAISDFVNKVAIPGYAELKTKAIVLNDAVIALNSNTTESNLFAARNAWKDLRSTWEKCEGYLFGPVEDDEYDPETDTWPVNFNDMDALLSSSQPLGLADIEALTTRSLKGYHPLEYMLWGQDGNKAAASFTARQKEYMTSLSLHLKMQAENLYNSWIPSSGNYADKFLKAGTGSNIFVKKQDAFIALTEGMTGICAEVADGKMKEPFDAFDPQIVESPFSGNSVTDFKNNIIGAYNVYQGKFVEDGTAIQDLVKLRNSSLNALLEQKFTAAINSFDAIPLPYEQAIINQRTQCQNTMNAITALSEILNDQLKPFVIANITD